MKSCQPIDGSSKQISEIVSELPSEDSAVRLDQISLDLNVSAEGNVQWIVGLGVAVGSTVTLTYKVSVAEGGRS